MANMHLVTGFAGREHVTAADHGSLHAALFGSGNYVLDKGGKFALTKISNNLIRIADGDLLMQGRYSRIEDGAYIELVVESGAAGYMRKDLVVARYTKSADSGVEECNIIILRGNPVGAAPADPEYITGDIIKDGAMTHDVPLYRLNLSGVQIASIDSLLPAVIPVLPEKIEDVALRVAHVEAALAAAEGVKIQTGSYTGTGKNGASSPNTLTFTFAPKFIFIISNKQTSSGFTNNIVVRGVYGQNLTNASDSDINSAMDGTTWGANSISWYSTASAANQANASATVYNWVAIG